MRSSSSGLSCSRSCRGCCCRRWRPSGRHRRLALLTACCLSADQQAPLLPARLLLPLPPAGWPLRHATHPCTRKSRLTNSHSRGGRQRGWATLPCGCPARRLLHAELHLCCIPRCSSLCRLPRCSSLCPAGCSAGGSAACCLQQPLHTARCCWRHAHIQQACWVCESPNKRCRGGTAEAHVKRQQAETRWCEIGSVPPPLCAMLQMGVG